MSSQDSHFRNVFGAILGILVAVTLSLLGLARWLDRSTADQRHADDPLVRAEVLERIRPLGRVALAGQVNSALALSAPAATPVTPTSAATAPEPTPAVAAASPAAAGPDGKAIFDSACNVCHGAGLAGAPKVGDKAGWAARIAQGTATLHQHAIQGYQGAIGVMPAKGGRTDLSDEAVGAAVDYMVAGSR
ncbi:MAG: cytochrome c5 family protein [Gammaproteobacteria bacterium]|nr:cytochrome c5 family protein [Gammaproteobacteria bacterium]